MQVSILNGHSGESFVNILVRISLRCIWAVVNMLSLLSVDNIVPSKVTAENKAPSVEAVRAPRGPVSLQWDSSECILLNMKSAPLQLC